MRVTVTGGCGFIGSHLAEALVKRGDFVTIADCLQLNYGFLSNIRDIAERVTFKRVNLSVFNEARDAVMGSDLVFHLASMSHLPMCRPNPLQTVESNYLATANVLEACRVSNVQRVVYAGTDHVYKADGSVISENSSLSPAEIYALTKAHSIQLCKMYSSVYGSDTVVLISSNVFGERQDGSKVVPIFVKQALQNMPLTVFGGQQSRDFYHVSNLIKAYLLVASKGVTGESYNVSGEREITVDELAHMIVTMAGSKSEILRGAHRADEPDKPRLHLNIGKIKSLGYREDVAFNEGLERTIDWYRANMGTTKCPEHA